MDEFFIAIKWPCVALLWSCMLIHLARSILAAKHMNSVETDELHKQISFWKEKAINYRKPNSHA